MNRLCLIPLCVAVPGMLCSCAPVAPMPQITSEYYPQCYAPFVELHEAQVAMRNRIIRTTAGSAFAGATAGALTGLLVGMNLKTTLVGGVVGAVGGGLIGFSVAQIKAIEDEKQRLAAYRTGMEVDLLNASAVELAALRSLRCYVREFESLRKDFAENRIRRETFTKRYAEIRTGILEIGKLTAEAQAMLVRRDAEFNEALRTDATSKTRSNKMTTVEKSRGRHERSSQKEVARYRKENRRKIRQQRTDPDFDEESALQLADLQSELNRLETRAAQRQDAHRTNLRTAASDTSTATAPPPVSMTKVTAVYNNYPEQIVSMEAVEHQRRLTLEIMGDVAEKSGIDMV